MVSGLLKGGEKCVWFERARSNSVYLTAHRFTAFVGLGLEMVSRDWPGTTVDGAAI